MNPELKRYREGIIETQRQLNESYDKLVVTLAGGALALSITFLKDIVSSDEINAPFLLLSSWALFVISLASILGEILFGIDAHKNTIKQIDDGTIYEQRTGGKSADYTKILHRLAAVSLLAGLIIMSIFSFLNLGDKSDGSKTTTKTPTEAATATKSTTRTETTERRVGAATAASTGTKKIT